MINKTLSRMLRDTSPSLRQSVTLRALTLLLVMCLSIGNVWGASTAELTLAGTKKFGTTSGSKLKDNVDTTWTCTKTGGSGGIQSAYNTSYHGQQFGTKNDAMTVTFSANFGTSTITSVKVDANTGGSATLSVKVGNTDFLCNNNNTASVKSNSSAKDATWYEFTGSATGNVVITLAGGSKACYFGGVNVTYTKGGSDPELTVSPETITFDPVAEGTASVAGQEVEITMANIAEVLVGFGTNSPFAVDKASLTESGIVTVTPKNTTLETPGEYADNLTITDGDQLEKTVAVSITVNALSAPSFTTQPVAASYEQGATPTDLSVVAEGAPTPSYQWYSNTTNSTSGATTLSGATNATYTPSTASIGTTYYYCIATNSKGSATSDIVAVEVTEHVVIPGTYNVVPKNTFWGNSQDGSKTVTAKTGFGPIADNDVTYSMNSGSSTYSYFNSTSTRVYSGYTFTITAPKDHKLSKIVFTGSTWSVPSVNTGVMDTKTWTGCASSVVFTFGGTSYMTNIATTFIVPAKSVISKDEIDNGDVVATIGEDTITFGETTVEESAVVTLNNTPEDGYKLTEYSVYKTDDQSTTVTVSEKNGIYTFTMPAYPVTVGATFEVAKVLQSVEITNPATTTEFWKGDTFSSAGLELTAHFTTGDEVVTPTSITGHNTSTAGNQTVTVSYTEGTITKSDKYDITVKTIENTPQTAYTTTEAIALIDANKDLTTQVYVKGIVSQNDGLKSNAITYWLDDNAFEVYLGKGIGGANFTSESDIQVNDTVVVKGTLKLYQGSKNIYELDQSSQLVSLKRPNVLQSIVLSGDTIREFTVGDAFSHEGMVVTAKYNVNPDADVTASATWSGYDMTIANNYEVTVSYTENEVEKTATYNIVVSPSSSCVKLATISKGQENNGTFALSIIGEQCADEAAISTVLTAEPAEHYHLASVTSLNAQEQTVGSIGAIADNECTISGIEESTTITAIFAENAKATATFAKGEESATGTAPADIEWYIGENITLPANTFTYAGHKFAGWNDGTSTYAAGASYEMPEGGKTFNAQWDELPIWATTYTSNVTGIGSSYKVKIAGTYYNANKQNKGASTSVTIPAGTTELHFHALAWSGEAQTITVSGNCFAENLQFSIVADNGVTGSNNTYTLQTNPSQVGYFSIPLSNINAATQITFQAPTNKRFVLFGVNAVQPAELTIDPAEWDFGNVKENDSTKKVFTITPNAFVTGDLTASFEGTNADKFTAVVDGNDVTVTFTPAEVGEDMEATLKVSADNADVTASLTGTGIAATTPEIVVSDELVNFGKIKKDASVDDQQVTITLNYLDAATASISGSVFSIDKTALEAGANTLTISANTAMAEGEYAETITITGTGAEQKQITVNMEILSKWAYEYTSNVKVGNDEVVIEGTNYNAIKKGSSENPESTTISVPKGTQTLHFHAAAWNTESTVLVVKQGSNQLGSFSLYKDAGVKSSSPFTLKGNNYSTDQYFHVDVAAYTATDEADITFTTTDSPYRFVLYGVNQEGGIVPVLQSIAISGTATKTTYEAGETFDPAGLTVNATYTLENVPQDAVDVTNKVDWTFTPDTMELATNSVNATATFEGKQASTDVAVTVTAPTPTITVNHTSVAFGEVNVGDDVDDKNVTVTLSNITGSATVTLTGEGASAFTVTPTALTESGDITISASTDNDGEFAATITITATGAQPVEIPVTMTVLVPDECDGTDDFNTVTPTTENTYINRTTTNGWTAVNTNLTMVGSGVDAETFFTINGKTSAVGVITSPELNGGISSLRVRYAYYTSEDNGVSFKVEIKKNGNVARTYTVTKSQSEVTKSEIYTEEINDINVVGKYQIVITNLSPSGKNSNKDRLSIGRLCWTNQEGYIRTLTSQNIGTICLDKATSVENYSGATFYEILSKDAASKNVTLQEVTALEAGMPYIFQPNANEIALPYTSAEAATTAKNKNGLYGWLSDDLKFNSTIDDKAAYFISGGKIKRCGNNCTIKTNRAYVVLDEVSLEEDSHPVAGRRRIVLGTEGANVVTGSEDILRSIDNDTRKVLSNGVIYILRNGKVYNAQGQIVK